MNYLWWKNFLFWHAYACWLLHVTATPKTLTILQSPPKQRICTISNSKNTNDSAISTETTDMHNAENSLDYDGTYTGTFPAADCPGINMTLTIKKDKTFELISEYIDRQDATFKEYGTYSVEGNIMTLINGEDKQYYKVGENTLTALNQDKQAITGELADHYILHKK